MENRNPKNLVIFTLFVFSTLPLLTGCGSQKAADAEQVTYQPRTQTVSVETVPVSQETLQTEIEFTGNLLPRRVTHVMPQVDGIVSSVPKVGAEFQVEANGKKYSEQLSITYGQKVKTGDVLVQLDTRDAEIALRLGQAKLKKAKADLANLKNWERPEEVARQNALVSEAKARYDHAVNELARMEKFYQKKVISRSAYDKSAADVATSQASLAAAQAALKKATAGPTEAEIAVQQAMIDQVEIEIEQQQRLIDKATIVAPFDGIITKFQVEVGDRVSPAGNPVAELMDLRYLIAEIAVPESYAGRVKVQDRTSVNTSGSSTPVDGIVIAVNELVDPTSRTFNLRIAIDNEQELFKAGQFASVKLSVSGTAQESLSVPNDAIVFVEGQPRVFVLNGETVSSRPVTIGVSNGRKTEVLDGLSLQDVVVVDDPALLSDGMVVTRKNTTGDPAVSLSAGEDDSTSELGLTSETSVKTVSVLK